MSIRKAPFPVLACALLLCACGYIVIPEEEIALVEGEGWSAIATSVGPSDAGDLRIYLTIRNGTGAWSAMRAIEDEPAVLTDGSGNDTECPTVFVSSGGHRLAPGFQMRGYIAGTLYEPETQLIYVDCPGAEATPGSTLSVEYVFFTGQYNYYEPEANKGDGVLEVNLDQVIENVDYPIAAEVEGLIQSADVEITALNDCTLTLTNVERTDTGLAFTWQADNPGEYPTYVHVGNPPVVGDDGILYGFYETPDIVSVPITPAGDSAEWTTEVAVPEDVGGFHIMLSVESGKARLFANYAIDVTDT